MGSRKRSGFASILIALGIVSVLCLWSLTLQLTSIRLNKRLIRRLDSLEGFYSGEIAAWHYHERDKESLASSGRAVIRFDNAYVTQVSLERDSVAGAGAGTALNVATTRDHAPADVLIRRFDASGFEYFNRNGALCGGQFRRVVCLYTIASRPPGRQQVYVVAVSERYLKCGKAGCRCGKEPGYSHGPYFSLTKSVKGKTVTRVIPKPAVELTKAQITQFQEFRRLNQEFLSVNEEICETKLREPGKENDRDQKKTSRRSLKSKSSERLKG